LDQIRTTISGINCYDSKSIKSSNKNQAESIFDAVIMDLENEGMGSRNPSTDSQVSAVETEGQKSQLSDEEKAHYEALKQAIVQPSTWEDVKNTKDEDKVTLWRGCTREQLDQMIKERSAGGITVSNLASKPDKEQIKLQKGRDEKKKMGGKENVSLPEFTTKMSIASSFARGEGEKYVMVVKIQKKYIGMPDDPGSEFGCITLREAPIEIVCLYKKH